MPLKNNSNSYAEKERKRNEETGGVILLVSCQAC